MTDVIEAPAAPAPAAAAPTNTPAPASTGSPIDTNSEIDALFAAEFGEKKLNEPIPPKPAQPKPEDKPKAEAPAAPKPATTPAKPEEKPVGGAAQLRKAYEDLKESSGREKNELIEKIAKLEKTMEERSKPVDDPEKISLKERVEELQKKFGEVDSEMRFVKYEKSYEYKEKYEQPLMKSVEAAEKEIKDMVVTDPQTGEERPATIEDFGQLLRMKIQPASKLARELFGEAATEILAHRRKILEQTEARDNAILEYRKKGADIEKQRESQSAAEKSKQEQMVAQGWAKANQHLRESKKELFDKVEGDDEGNKLLDQWGKFVDHAMNPQSDLPMEKRIQYLAIVRNKAAAFDRVVNQSSKLKAENEALKQELEQFRGSTPKPGGNQVRQTVPGRKSADEELEALAGPR